MTNDKELHGIISEFLKIEYLDQGTWARIVFGDRLLVLAFEKRGDVYETTKKYSEMHSDLVQLLQQVLSDKARKGLSE